MGKARGDRWRQSAGSKSAAQALLKHALRAEAQRGGKREEIIERAVTRTLRERKRRPRRSTFVSLREHDPLRELLDLPEMGPLLLPKEDVRVHMTREGGSVHQLLSEASRFSQTRLRALLGEELWGLCHPVGFSGAQERTVLVEVGSAAASHEVSMRKRELLVRLKAAPGFEKVRDVRFHVKEPSARDVLPKGPPPPTGHLAPSPASEENELSELVARLLARARED